MMRIRKRATVLALLGVLVLILIVAVQPVLACRYGCTPGFWKQPHHFGYWTGYSPGQTVGSVFVNAWTYFPDLADDTLLQALDYGGGRGLEGAARIYLRAAVATLLNSAYNSAHGGSWWYGDVTPAQVVDWVNEVLSWDNRVDVLSDAEWFDGINNAGCPLEGQLWE